MIGTSVGNVYIKHVDRWRRAYYLTPELEFQTQRAAAGRFLLNKPGNTPINNGDRISVQYGNQFLIVNKKGEVQLIDRLHIGREPSSFLVTNGADTFDPIGFEEPICLISNKAQHQALQFEPIMAVDDQRRLKGGAKLVNGNYEDCEVSALQSFKLQLEAVAEASTPSHMMAPSPRHVVLAEPPPQQTQHALVVVLLLIILLLCAISSRP